MKHNLYISIFAISLMVSSVGMSQHGRHEDGIVDLVETIKDQTETIRRADSNSEYEPPLTGNPQDKAKLKADTGKKREEAEAKIGSKKTEIEALIAGGSLLGDTKKQNAGGLDPRPYVKKLITDLIDESNILNDGNGETDVAKQFVYRKKVNDLLSGLTDKSMKSLGENIKAVADKLGLKGEARTIFEQSVKAWSNSSEQNRKDLKSGDSNTQLAAKKAIEGKFEEFQRANQNAIPKDFRLPGDSDGMASKAYLLERQTLADQMQSALKEEPQDFKKANEVNEKMKALSADALEDNKGWSHNYNLGRFASEKTGKTTEQLKLYSEITAAAKVLTDKKEAAKPTNSSAQSSNSSTAISSNESKPTPAANSASSKKSPRLDDIVKKIDDTQDAGSKVDTAVKNAAATAKKTVEGSPYIPAARLLKSVLGLTEAGAKAGVGKAVLNAANNVHVEKNYDDPSKKIHKEVLAINEAAKNKQLSNFKASADGGNLGYQSAKDGKNMDAVTMFTADGSSIKATFAADLNDKAYVTNNRNETFATYKTANGEIKYLAVEKNAGTKQWQQKTGALLSNVTEYAGAAQNSSVPSLSPATSTQGKLPEVTISRENYSQNEADKNKGSTVQLYARLTKEPHGDRDSSNTTMVSPWQSATNQQVTALKYHIANSLSKEHGLDPNKMKLVPSHRLLNNSGIVFSVFPDPNNNSLFEYVNLTDSGIVTLGKGYRQ